MASRRWAPPRSRGQCDRQPACVGGSCPSLGCRSPVPPCPSAKTQEEFAGSARPVGPPAPLLHSLRGIGAVLRATGRLAGRPARLADLVDHERPVLEYRVRGRMVAEGPARMRRPILGRLAWLLERHPVGPQQGEARAVVCHLSAPQKCSARPMVRGEALPAVRRGGRLLFQGGEPVVARVPGELGEDR